MGFPEQGEDVIHVSEEVVGVNCEVGVGVEGQFSFKRLEQFDDGGGGLGLFVLHCTYI